MERMMKEQMQELRRFLAEGKITEDQFAKNEEGLKAHYASMKAEAEEQTTLLINDATAGDAAAQWELGRAYLDGNGVERSDEIGLAWYTKAAEAGHARAQCSVAVAHCNGRGTPMCRKTAAIWYEKAALQGNLMAQCNLGQLYQNGEGVEKCLKTALSWYEMVAENGNSHDYAAYEQACELAAHLRATLGLEPIITTDPKDGATVIHTVIHMGTPTTDSTNPETVHLQCGLPSCPTAATKKCTGCGTQWYCSKACQRGHWRAHKTECRKIAPAE